MSNSRLRLKSLVNDSASRARSASSSSTSRVLNAVEICRAEFSSKVSRFSGYIVDLVGLGVSI